MLTVCGMNVLSGEATRALLSAASQQAGSQGQFLYSGGGGGEHSGKRREKELKGWCFCLS